MVSNLLKLIICTFFVLNPTTKQRFVALMIDNGIFRFICIRYCLVSTSTPAISLNITILIMITFVMYFHNFRLLSILFKPLCSQPFWIWLEAYHQPTLARRILFRPNENVLCCCLKILCVCLLSFSPLMPLLCSLHFIAKLRPWAYPALVTSKCFEELKEDIQYLRLKLKMKTVLDRDYQSVWLSSKLCWY